MDIDVCPKESAVISLQHSANKLYSLDVPE